ncbi:hypothetical protein [Aurantivibrio plasticivorans]
MERRNKKLFSLFFACAMAWLSPLAPACASPVVIHHPQLASEDFSTTSLVRIYAMQKRVWSDRSSIKVFTLPKDSGTHKEFVKGLLLMQPYQLDRLWHRLVFSGTGSTPEEVSSPEEMIEKVRSTPGSIGYIDSKFLGAVDQRMYEVAQ